MLAAVVLVVGLVSALAIYVTAPPDDDDPMSAQIGSKLYRHDLELYGGKANILQDEFRRWFSELWHGRELAGTVAFLSVLTFACVRYIAGLVYSQAQAEGASPDAPATGPERSLRLVRPDEGATKPDVE